MCGIVGFTGQQAAAPLLLEGLKRLEYRGYDSAGIAVIGPEGITLDEAKQVFGNYDNNFVISNGFTTRPYEMRVYLF